MIKMKSQGRMKAAVLAGPRKIEVREALLPSLQRETDVLIRVAATGICGSDIHYFCEGKIGDQVVEYPFVAGHECAGIVEQVGRRVTRLKSGDRVVIDPAVVCGTCDQCLSGRPNTCRNLLFLGAPGELQGSLSEFVVIPEGNCHRLAGSVSWAEAVLVEPLSIGIYSLKLMGDTGDDKIAVLGSGPIGLSVLLAAQASGVRVTYATDKIEARLKAARTAGAGWSANPERTDIVAEIREREPGLLDAVFECCGDQAALDQAVDLLKPGGKLMILGIPPSNRVSFDIHRLRRREIGVINVRRQRHCFPDAVRLIEKKRVDVRFMATHEFSLEQAARAFELAAGYGDGVIKAVIRTG
jgi:L-iditol 2-dehydrogenase